MSKRFNIFNKILIIRHRHNDLRTFFLHSQVYGITYTLNFYFIFYTKENSLEVQCIDIKKWLDENIPHSALAVAKIDIEKTEFEVIPYLLKYPNTFRIIDELYLECHHVETWGHRPHTFKECLKMFKDIRKIGIIVHEWF